MRRIEEELKAGSTILTIIDRRRVETGDMALGSAIEKSILDRCLADLETDFMDERVLVPVRTLQRRSSQRGGNAGR